MDVADVDPDSRAWLIAEHESFEMAVSVQRADVVRITKQARQGRPVKQQDAVSTMQYGKAVVFETQLMKGRHFLLPLSLSGLRPFIADHVAAEMAPGWAVIR
ncbi:hypothetical protein [Stutzerimonas nitrititolerans]|uniref:hypothetical protein n=1 Tax=Stutzerimonas nitrititolerans TaxID=2482751 RepID=UPI002897D923|nr:hypothetical protein [Stutzerimonas nitrititolerans]